MGTRIPMPGWWFGKITLPTSMSVGYWFLFPLEGPIADDVIFCCDFFVPGSSSRCDVNFHELETPKTSNPVA